MFRSLKIEKVKGKETKTKKMCSFNPFTEEDIANAKLYKYNGTDDSICCKLFLRRYWNWLIEFVPLNIAPNTITFIGFLFEAFSFLLSVHLTKGLTEPLPAWAAITNAICLFIYQTLDNLDGRQARRTGMSSPLGQFFDHGCDAITGVFELIKSACVLNLGPTYICFLYALFTGIGFVLASYEEYVTHRFYLGLFNAPDEGILILCSMYIFVASCPSCLSWFRPLFVIAYIVADIFTIFTSFYNIAKHYKEDKECKTRMIVSIIPMCISVAVICLLAHFHRQYIKTVTFIMAIEFILTFNSQTIIISYLTKRPPSKLFEPITIIFWIISLLSLLPAANEIVESGVFWYILCGYIFLAMVFTDVRVVIGFSKGLEIPAFHVKKQKE